MHRRPQSTAGEKSGLENASSLGDSNRRRRGAHSRSLRGLIAEGQETMALAWEQFATATAEAQKLRASVVRKLVQG